jgi:hypothetical protein
MTKNISWVLFEFEQIRKEVKLLDHVKFQGLYEFVVKEVHPEGPVIKE